MNYQIFDGKVWFTPNTPLLGLMKSERIFHLYGTGDGDFQIEEACDGYFGINLTRGELIAMADEIRAFADYVTSAIPEAPAPQPLAVGETAQTASPNLQPALNEPQQAQEATKAPQG